MKNTFKVGLRTEHSWVHFNTITDRHYRQTDTKTAFPAISEILEHTVTLSPDFFFSYSSRTDKNLKSFSSSLSVLPPVLPTNTRQYNDIRHICTVTLNKHNCAPANRHDISVYKGRRKIQSTHVCPREWMRTRTAGVRQFLKITGLFVVRSFKTKHKKNIFRFFIVKCNSIHKTQAFHQSCAETLPSIQSLISSGWVSETTETVAVVRWVQVLACCGGSELILLYPKFYTQTCLYF